MQINHYESVSQKPVEMDGASGCKVRWLVGKNEGAPNFAMRQFEIEPGGHSPRHFHPYEHEVFVIDGSGIILEGDQEHEIKSGDVIYVSPDEVHQFQNRSDVPLRFLCLIPNSALDKSATVVPECGLEA
jgi:quercetin dioxygenase-like cupin family protein